MPAMYASINSNKRLILLDIKTQDQWLSSPSPGHLLSLPLASILRKLPTQSDRRKINYKNNLHKDRKAGQGMQNKSINFSKQEMYVLHNL